VTKVLSGSIVTSTPKMTREIPRSNGSHHTALSAELTDSMTVSDLPFFTVPSGFALKMYLSS
jgi:hypothetical protein